MSWQTCQLGDVVELRYGKSLPDRDRKFGEVPVYGSGGICGWHDISLVSGPGIIVGRKGSVGSVFFEPRNFFPIDTAYYVVPKANQIDLRYAYFLLCYLPLAQMNSDVAVPGLNRDRALGLGIRVPSFAVQKTIASILSTYDDLIENNRRRMALLEESARLLYREWFVRLRFPGYEHTPIVDGVPQGWCNVSLAEITTKIGSGFTPRGGEASYHSEGVTLIRSMNVYDDNFDDGGLAFLSEEQAATLAGVAIEAKDVLINITGASVARCCMAPERYLPARVNQHVMIIRVDPGKADPFFVHKAINSDEKKRLLLSYAQKGSTREALTKEGMARFEITVPTASLMRQFGEIAASSFRQREILAHQNQKLRTARDLLLPRLMSGELAV